ncbi:MAG: hypothetical protein U0531_00865 [Dehalococcoidia bacterium]
MFNRVRLRIALLYVTLTSALLLLVAGAVTVSAVSTARHKDDEELRRRAEVIVAISARVGPPPEPLRVALPPYDPEGADSLDGQGILAYVLPDPLRAEPAPATASSPATGLEACPQPRDRKNRRRQAEAGSADGGVARRAARLPTSPPPARATTGANTFTTVTVSQRNVRLLSAPVLRDGEVTAVVRKWPAPGPTSRTPPGGCCGPWRWRAAPVLPSPRWPATGWPVERCAPSPAP